MAFIDAREVLERLVTADRSGTTKQALLIRDGYEDYLRTVLRRGEAVLGIPIFISYDTQRLASVQMGPHNVDRRWFEDRKMGGVEVKWLHPVRAEGFQWWILTWGWDHGRLNIDVSHWLINRDTDLKRNTVYLTRSYRFTETDGTDRVSRLISVNTAMRNISVGQKQVAWQCTRQALKSDQESDWVTEMAPYGLLEMRNTIDWLIREFDTDGMIDSWLDRKFRQHYLNVLLKVLYPDKDNVWRQNMIADDGLLTEQWYVPNLENDIDAKNFAERHDEWQKVLAAYKDWNRRFFDVLAGKPADTDHLPEFPSRSGVTQPAGP